MTSGHSSRYPRADSLGSLDNTRFNRFVENVEQELRSETAASFIVGFNFGLKDIREIEAVVTRMAFLGAAKV